jgi:hypothetical protein
MAQSPSPTEPKWGRLGFGVFSKTVSYTCQGRSVMPEVGKGQEGWPAGHVYSRSAVQVLQTTSSLQWRSSSPPINDSIPLGIRETRKCGLASYRPHKFILCRVERERRGSEGRRTFWLVGSPPSSLSVKALPESIQVRWSFLSSSSFKCGRSTGILQILAENRILSPSDVLVFWLVIVSHSFAALMLFVHLHTISRIGVCFVVYTVPCLWISRV